MEGARTTAWARRAAPSLLALLVHVCAALLVARLPVRHAGGSNTLSSDNVPIDVTLTADEPLPVESASANGAPSPSEETRAPDAALARAASRSAEGTGEARPDTEPRIPNTSDETAPPAQDGTGEPARGERGPIVLAPTRPTDIGIGGTNRFLPRSQAAVEKAVAQRAIHQTLLNAARERDTALGLGPEGPVLTALAEGTAESVAPVRGRAVFVATSNAAGEVVSLELLDAEGGRPGWADAARIALVNLKGKKLRVPPGSTRAVMKIEVTSAWKLPSGQDPGTDVTLFHVPIAKGEGKDSGKVSILDPIPKVRVDYLELGPGVKIPVPTVELDIFSATSDPSNVGAKARRVIHTHLLDSQVM